MFETNDLEQGWDGTYKDLFVNEDVHDWKVRIVDLNNDLQEYTGGVTILK